MLLKDYKTKKIPDTPGVYFFKKGKDILYIGKATSLKDRVRSYFGDDLINTRGSRIVDMVTLANTIDFQKTDSVLEALILESALIKKYKPKYNIKEKDNKSYYHVVITEENFPRVLMIREQDLKIGSQLNNLPKIKKQFGPFPNAGQLKEALHLIQKLFPFFDLKKSVDELNQQDLKRISLKMSLGLYPKTFDKKEYQKNIKNIEMFFMANKKGIIKNLEKEMKSASQKQEFERAGEIKKRIFALKHINDLTLIQNEKIEEESNFRIEAYDIAHLQGNETVGVMVVLENGSLNHKEYKKFLIKSAKTGDDYGALAEILNRRFAHQEWHYPNLIVIDGGKGQMNRAKKELEKFGIKIPIVSVVKNEKHKPKQILGSNKYIFEREKEILLINSEAHRFAINFHRRRRKNMLK